MLLCHFVSPVGRRLPPLRGATRRATLGSSLVAGEQDRRAWTSWGSDATEAPPLPDRRRFGRPGRGRIALAAVLLVGVAVSWAALARPGPSDQAEADVETSVDRFYRDSAPLGTPAPLPTAEGPFRFLYRQGDGTGAPVAYDPCFPIHYVVRPDGAPEGGERLLAEGIREVSRATGLVFVDDGPTAEAPSNSRGAYRVFSGTYEPVLIAWSTEQESPRLAGDVLGYAGSAYIEGNLWSTKRAPGSRHYVSGQVVLDALDLTAESYARPDDRVTSTVILHELGHLVGLAHVKDPSQVMYRESTSVHRYQAGDLRGLHQLGKGHCFVS
jgi:hypothetical protein